MKKYIEELFEKITEEERSPMEIKKMIHRLDKDYSNEIIDYMLEENIENFWLYYKNCVKLLIYVLVEKDYYKEKLINVFKEEKVNFSAISPLLIEKLKINNKEIFIKILNSSQVGINFFFLNYENFDYNEEEKNTLQNYLNKKAKGLNNFVLDLNKEQLEKIKEKIGIFQMLLSINLYKNLDKNFNEKFDFFTNNFKYLENNRENILFLHMTFFSDIECCIEYLSKNKYNYFFEKNADYLEAYYYFLKEIMEKSKEDKIYFRKIEKISKYNESLLLELQLKNF